MTKVAGFSAILGIILTFLAAVVPLAVFAPALRNGFVWDDQFNFVTNPGYRGLGAEQLRWMVTNTRLSHWIPVTWLTFGLDYVVWGMDPAGYHLTNVLLHAMNAWLFCLVALRLLHLAMPAGDRRGALAGALVASLFFSIHPLRVESVSWITERRDVLSGLFFLGALLAYLRAHDPDGTRRRPWMVVSLVAFQLGVLAKSIVITLPLIFLILDAYPLRRLALEPARWLSLDNRRVVTEKLPFVPMAVFGGLVATTIIDRAGEFTPLSLLERLALMLYSFWYYAATTFLPLGLSPLYELPTVRDPWQPRFLLPIMGCAIVSVAVVALARRWPAGLTIWLCYLVMIGPVSGVKHTGVQIVADRYSYLSCLPWAVMLGGAVCAVVQRVAAGRWSVVRARVLWTVAVVWLITLSVVTLRLIPAWRDSETLWRHAVAHDPACYACRHNLGTALLADGHRAAAIEELERAVALRPQAPFSRGALVYAYLEDGAPDKARAQLVALRRADPELARELAPLFVGTW